MTDGARISSVFGARIERLEAELEAWRDHWGCDVPQDLFVNSPMGAIYDRQQAQINVANHEIEQLRAALLPFAAAAGRPGRLLDCMTDRPLEDDKVEGLLEGL